jgi:hypothetical protein
VAQILGVLSPGSDEVNLTLDPEGAVIWCGQNPKAETSGCSGASRPKNASTLPAYEVLATLNRDMEQVLLDLERLGASDILPHRWQRKFWKVCRATLEETRAWANFKLIEVLHARSLSE